VNQPQLTVSIQNSSLKTLYDQHNTSVITVSHTYCTPHSVCSITVQHPWINQSINLRLLARDVIYTSRAYAMMPVSVCLWRLCTVVTGCDGSRISLHAWIDGCLYYLLTTPNPDRRIGCQDFWWKRGGYRKSGNCRDITYFTYILSMDHNHMTYLIIWTILTFFMVISVENALCLKTVRLITTSA